MLMRIITEGSTAVMPLGSLPLFPPRDPPDGVDLKNPPRAYMSQRPGTYETKSTSGGATAGLRFGRFWGVWCLAFKSKNTAGQSVLEGGCSGFKALPESCG